MASCNEYCWNPVEVFGPKGVTTAREHVSHVGKAPTRLASSIHKSKQGLVFLLLAAFLTGVENRLWEDHIED
jgi:hypothetical protein